MAKAFRLVLASGLLFATAAMAADSAEPPLKPAAGPIVAEGSFGFTAHWKKPKNRDDGIIDARRAASGVACWPASDSGSRRCLIVFDEGPEARFAAIGESSFKPDTTVVRLREGAEEVDAEGAAAGGGYLYVVGSHAKKRKIENGACKPNKDSATLARFTVDEAGTITGEASQGFLRKALESSDLKDALDKCLGDAGGLDIEGVAATDGKLWFGLRGPTKGAQAWLLGADAAALIQEGAAAAVETQQAEVGEGRGVRDMQALGEGRLLLLVGPGDADDTASYGFAIHDLGTGKTSDVRRIDLSGVVGRAKLDGCEDSTPIKPEAISVVDPAADPLKVLVLSDGLCDGGPMWFDLPRPR